jgi:hypothetical protein
MQIKRLIDDDFLFLVHTLILLLFADVLQAFLFGPKLPSLMLDVDHST